jgi:3-methyladenine DNA glycosylase Mpg
LGTQLWCQSNTSYISKSVALNGHGGGAYVYLSEGGNASLNFIFQNCIALPKETSCGGVCGRC